MKKLMLEKFQTWELVHDKGVKWLFSIKTNIIWTKVMKYLL